MFWYIQIYKASQIKFYETPEILATCLNESQIPHFQFGLEPKSSEMSENKIATSIPETLIYIFLLRIFWNMFTLNVPKFPISKR